MAVQSMKQNKIYKDDLINKSAGNYKGNEEHIYVNLTIPYRPDAIGSTVNSSDALLDQYQSTPVLYNPSNYHFILTRFRLNGELLPLHIWDPDITSTVRISYNGDVQDVNLIYTTNSGLQPYEEGYYYIYDFQQYVDMLNTALSTAFTALGAPPAGSVAPFMVWDSNSQKFIFFAQKDYYDLSLALPIEVFFNTPVADLFGAFAYDTSNPNFSQLLINDYYNNNLYSPVGPPAGYVQPYQFPTNSEMYLFLEQQFSEVHQWNGVKSIVFTSSSISVKNTFSSINVNSNSANNASLPILIDFLPDIENSGDIRKELIYYANPYKPLDMLGSQPLSYFNINVYFTDREDKLRPVRIPNNNTIDLQILFRRKPQLNYI